MSVLTRLQGNGKGSCGLADAGLKTVILLQNRLEVSFNRSSTEFRTDIEGLMSTISSESLKSQALTQNWAQSKHYHYYTKS